MEGEGGMNARRMREERGKKTKVERKREERDERWDGGSGWLSETMNRFFSGNLSVCVCAGQPVRTWYPVCTGVRPLGKPCMVYFEPWERPNLQEREEPAVARNQQITSVSICVFTKPTETLGSAQHAPKHK